MRRVDFPRVDRLSTDTPGLGRHIFFVREELQWIENGVSSLVFRIFTKIVEVNVWKLEIN